MIEPSPSNIVGPDLDLDTVLASMSLTGSSTSSPSSPHRPPSHPTAPFYHPHDVDADSLSTSRRDPAYHSRWILPIEGISADPNAVLGVSKKTSSVYRGTWTRDEEDGEDGGEGKGRGEVVAVKLLKDTALDYEVPMFN